MAIGIDKVAAEGSGSGGPEVLIGLAFVDADGDEVLGDPVSLFLPDPSPTPDVSFSPAAPFSLTRPIPLPRGTLALVGLGALGALAVPLGLGRCLGRRSGPLLFGTSS